MAGMTLSIRGKILLLVTAVFLVNILILASGALKILRDTLGLPESGSFALSSLISMAAIFIVVDAVAVKRQRSLFRSLGTDRDDARGDLTRRLPVRGLHEIGLFSRFFNVFSARIHNIISKMKIISANSERIGLGLAASVSELASSIEEISATMNSVRNNENKLENVVKSTREAITDINGSITAIAGSIRNQSRLLEESSAATQGMVSSIRDMNGVTASEKTVVEELNRLAKDGQSDMERTLESIRDISRSAEAITGLVDVINNVANQTNILAMNAAIEAAHAGDAGKGFSVVAEEIRKLAETTSENVKDISSIISAIVARIQDAAGMTEKTNDSMRIMADGIGDMSGSLESIARGLEEIVGGSETVTGKLAGLDAMTASVQRSSDEIVAKSGAIEKLMADASFLSERSTNSIDEITTAIEGINNTTVYLNSVGNENAEYIRIMKNEVGQFRIIDTSDLKTSDGHDLVIWNRKPKKIPARPDDPSRYPEDDDRHWYDYEYAGFGVKKINMPPSLTDGAAGKKIIWVRPGEHPYYSAEENGMKRVAEAYGMEVRFLAGDWKEETQGRLIDRAIREKPDFMIVTPINAVVSTKWFQKLNGLSIPVVTCTSTPSDEGFKYILGHAGEDGWGLSRLLAGTFAELMGFEGGYCIVQHLVGNSNYYARTWSFLTELKKIAPKMHCLDMQSSDLELGKTRDLVKNWISKYGSDFKGLVIGDSGDPLAGAMEAVEQGRREDIVCVTVGNSKYSLDLMKRNRLHAIAWQSPESDGALAVGMAVDFFNGLEMDPVRYLPPFVITKDIVDRYYPPQW